MYKKGRFEPAKGSGYSEGMPKPERNNITSQPVVYRLIGSVRVMALNPMCARIASYPGCRRMFRHP